MFLPATINQKKYGTTFRISESKENFFYFLFYQNLPYTIILFLLIILTIIGIYYNSRFVKYISFATLVLYVSIFVIGIPTFTISNNNTVLAGLSLFWMLHGLGYIVSVTMGFIFLLGIQFYKK